nr:regulator of MON1-CCZ1 complex homolog isoform X1 [Megalopta genalis]XP_033322246.1 regulator of MON1-CCZ1 complex homolog isoform X1 [Megalopta genalis]XP_033322247.1 regulator of MON1-CCZ1 complex homolog isoform X1 [Megalopta genalis]
MLRLPVVTVAIISMLVSGNTVLPNAVVQKGATETSAIPQTKIDATNSPSINDSSDAITSVDPGESKKGGVDVNKTAASPKTTNVPGTIPQHIANPSESEKHKKCNSTKEPEDMQGCYVTPSDSGENVDENATQTVTESTTIASAVTKKPEANKTESQTPEPSPEKPKENDNRTNNKKKVNKDDNKENDNNKKKVTVDNNGKSNTNVTIVMINSTKPTDHVVYEVVSTEASHEKNTNDTGNGTIFSTVQPVAVDGTTVSTNSVAPLIADKGAIKEPGDVVAQVKSAERKKSMPSGVIALITAMSFGVAIATVYIGMIVWRRYVEYRYGHRELLVNELEFDTNDLRHFEL